MTHYILVDCNNFYASCERLFNPRLEGCPLIVLSNNDGCVVARSQEAKKLGIAMGEPFFKIRELCCKSGVAVFSSNYQLYGDLSQRVMQLLAEMAPGIQVYSIDEAFLTFPKSMAIEEVRARCAEIRSTIRRWVGIPTSLGIAPTKTLAKVANELAKKDRTRGIFDLSDLKVQEEMLASFAVGDIWGVGGRSEKKLKMMGIDTAWKLRQACPSAIRRKMGVVGERIVLELNGISCLPLTDVQPKKSIASSRSFGKKVDNLQELSEALSTYVANACLKLRQQSHATQALSVYLEAIVDPEKGTRQHYSTTLPLPLPMNDTPRLIEAANWCLKKLYRKGERYKKCGVILLDLLPEKEIIPDLFDRLDPKRRRLAETVDALNARLGRNTLFYAAMGVYPKGAAPQWKTRSDRRSRRYTTCWEELAIVKAS